MAKNFVILGAGISGLATAWFLKSFLNQDTSITILEGSLRVGGWIETKQCDDFLFEQGPRSLRATGAFGQTIELITALGLQDQVITSSPNALYKYILVQGRLKALPKHIWQIPFFASTQGWMHAIARDWFLKPAQRDDESVSTFFTRHFGNIWTDNFIDPMVLGIYAGDCKSLSIKSCFPLFDTWACKYGSLIKGAWHTEKPPATNCLLTKAIANAAMFSFRHGMEMLPKAIAKYFTNNLHLNSTVKLILPHADKVTIVLEDGTLLDADHVISTLPLTVLSKIIPPVAVPHIKYANVAVVNMGFHGCIASLNGFGYLIPSTAKSPVLGCVYDSSVFPQHNKNILQTRLGVMLGGVFQPHVAEMTAAELSTIALKAIKEHLGIVALPQAIQINMALKAIPQYEVGYQSSKETFLRTIKSYSSRITVSGSSISGVSIHDCIAHAKQVALSLATL